MSFYDEWAKLDWGEQQAWVLAQTDADVERALARLARSGKRELAAFAALISPAAEKYLLPMTELSTPLICICRSIWRTSAPMTVPIAVFR